MTRRKVCSCGERYDRFRTGHTFASVKQLMYTGDPDPSTWRHKGRRAVLGYWTEIKRQLWDERHQGCPDSFDVAIADNVIPFQSRAGAEAYARVRARRDRKPVRVDVKAGETVLVTWQGDYHGNARRAA